eukprot:8789075-Ditylum_brightwellii.AAC.1
MLVRYGPSAIANSAFQQGVFVCPSPLQVLHLVFRCVLLQDCACQHVSMSQEGVCCPVHIRNWMVHQGFVPFVLGVSLKHILEGN